MLDAYKELITNQFDASLCMLGACLDRCPENQWHAPVANLKYCQVAFHTLFFADVYLGVDLDSLRRQPFHAEHATIFADYEEIGGGLQQAVYEKPFIGDYIEHCRAKAAQVVTNETEESLQLPAGFDWLEMPRAELHVYNIRHIHHHAAQLSLHLRINTGEGIPWVKSGWREV